MVERRKLGEMESGGIEGEGRGGRKSGARGE